MSLNNKKTKVLHWECKECSSANCFITTYVADRHISKNFKPKACLYRQGRGSGEDWKLLKEVTIEET
ncbi:MAG: hypothetical protein KAS32_25315 [Candidatus Peribacteraceae bacterium]|nr:hypothetical protein [Candidatus Peribacteraceae bacterium]